MKKPSQFVFLDVGSVSINPVKDHGEDLFRAKDIIKVLDRYRDDKESELFLKFSTYSYRDSSMKISFIQKEEKSKDEFHRDMIEYEFAKKAQETQTRLKNKLVDLQVLEKTNSYAEELAYARVKLEEFTGNNKIPLCKKEEIISKWTKKVNLLEQKVDPNASSLIQDLKKQIQALNNDIEFQNEIANLSARREEIPPHCAVCDARSYEDDGPESDPYDDCPQSDHRGPESY